MIHRDPHRAKHFVEAVTTSAILSCTDAGGCFTYVNRNFCETTGYAENELLGKSSQMMNSEVYNTEFWSVVWTHISDGNSWRGEVQNKRKDNTYFWLDTFIYPIINDDNEIIELIAVQYDITNLKNQEDKIERQNTLIARIAWLQSHGLRRPVSSILGLIQLFQSEQNSERDMAHLICHLRTISEDLDQQIKEIVRLTEGIAVSEHQPNR